jgi:opacity protein-like surface antigen
MKKLIFLLLVLLNFNSFAQINGKNKELSFSGSFGAVKSSYDYKSTNYNYSSESDLNFYFLSNLRFGYFLNNHFEIEPELQLLVLQSVDPFYSLNANIAYNIQVDSSRIKPFILIGYGIGNSVPFYGSLVNFDSIERELSVKQLNFGFGIKIFVSDNLAIRTEYRFQQYMYKRDYSNVNAISDYTYSFHNILFGLSFFL